MKSQRINLTDRLAVKRGTTRVIRVTVNDPNDQINFAGATIDGRIGRKLGQARVDTFGVTYITRNLGTFVANLLLTDSQTNNLKGEYYWEAILTIPLASTVWSVAEGDLEVRDRIL